MKSLGIGRTTRSKSGALSGSKDYSNSTSSSRRTNKSKGAAGTKGGTGKGWTRKKGWKKEATDTKGSKGTKRTRQAKFEDLSVGKTVLDSSSSDEEEEAEFEEDQPEDESVEEQSEKGVADSEFELDPAQEEKQPTEIKDQKVVALFKQRAIFINYVREIASKDSENYLVGNVIRDDYLKPPGSRSYDDELPLTYNKSEADNSYINVVLHILLRFKVCSDYFFVIDALIFYIN